MEGSLDTFIKNEKLKSKQSYAKTKKIRKKHEYGNRKYKEMR